MNGIDLTNKRFGRLIAISRVGTNKHGKTMWLCQCDCGNQKTIVSGSLISQNTKSCGCLKMEMIKNLNKKHMLSHTRLYYIWQCMIARCSNPNSKSYKNYGARGITVCKEWKNNFKSFEIWALENGYKEGLTIERKDNDKGYSLENCKWATYKEQAINKRNNKYIHIDNKEILISEACKKCNINMSTVFSSLKRNNITLQEAFEKQLNRTTE